MSVRSVIDVDVSAAAFEKFSKLFDSYSEKLRKQPEIWKKITHEHEKLSKGLGSLGNNLDVHFEGLQALKDADEANEKSLLHSHELWSGIEKSSSHTARNILSGTTSLLKWSGLLAGVGGLLSYFTVDGLMGLGQNVFGWRKTSMGLGTTIGQQRAFSIAFSRLLNPDQFLSGVATAGADISSPAYRSLIGLGVNPNGSTSDVAVSLLQHLYSLSHGMSTRLLGPSLETPYHLENFGIGTDTLRILQSMGPAEFAQLLATYRKQQAAQNIGDRTAKAWTDFVTSMDTAKATIESVFVKGLANLAGPIGNLANGFTNLLSVVMTKNGPIAKDINAIADWMKSFNGEITKPEFLTGLKNLVDIIGDLGTAGSKAASFLDKLAGIKPNGTNPPFKWHLPTPMDAYQFGISLRSRYERWRWTNTANAMDPTGLLALVGNLESGMNPYAPNSSKGAIGMMQIMPAVAASLGIDPHDPGQALRGANAELAQLHKEYGRDILKILAAYNWGEGNLNRDVARYGNAWQQHLPAETMNYIMKAIKAILSGSVKVDVQNGTGANITQTFSGLGAQR